MLPSDWLVWCRYDTAVTRDLWAALTKASTKGLDVAAMMDTWTLQVNIGRMVRILGCHWSAGVNTELSLVSWCKY